jgi:glycerophosphoryl diester phosphodiesterase
MIIISHRGYWKDITEKNQIISFKRSFAMGFGTETDIRDYENELVISHNIANEDCIKVESFFELYRGFGKKLPLALNIKATGLQQKLKALLERYEIKNYFVFDMSIPDGLGYLQEGFKVFTRQSEYEHEPSFYKDVDGVWLDEFHMHWSDESVITGHINTGKKVCIVSPEIHGRDNRLEWEDYKKIDEKLKNGKLMICTDRPEKAKEYFDA